MRLRTLQIRVDKKCINQFVTNLSEVTLWDWIHFSEQTAPSGSSWWWSTVTHSSNSYNPPMSIFSLAPRCSHPSFSLGSLSLTDSFVVCRFLGSMAGDWNPTSLTRFNSWLRPHPVTSSYPFDAHQRNWVERFFPCKENFVVYGPMITGLWPKFTPPLNSLNTQNGPLSP